MVSLYMKKKYFVDSIVKYPEDFSAEHHLFTTGFDYLYVCVGVWWSFLVVYFPSSNK